VRPDAHELRARLANARVMLVFTPELARDPRAALEAVLPHVDVVQVRPKAPGASGPTEARAAYDWCERVLALTAARDDAPLVIVNDRVDVARAHLDAGLAGVHVGQGDTPPAAARAALGDVALIGLSTHEAAQVVLGAEEPVDYLGFGPIHATPTKGYTRGLGPERAWVAREASSLPLFAIGGITRANVADLARVGRVAVGSELLRAADPGRAAAELRELLLVP
jgi:thiamine-phosphate pyrophosphorylase